MRIFKNWREQRRNQAARVIQKHWRQGLVRDVRPGTTEMYGLSLHGLFPHSPVVHRSRVVSHNGKKYNARTIMLANSNNSNNNNGPNNSYWPGTRNVIDRYNKQLIVHRGKLERSPRERRVNAMLPKVKAAMEAYKRGRFEPYRKAWWGHFTFHFRPFHVLPGMSSRPDFVKRFPMSRAWSESTVLGLLQRLVPTPARLTGLYPWPPGSNERRPVVVFTSTPRR